MRFFPLVFPLATPKSLLCTLCLFLYAGCAPSRAPIAPGTIPDPKQVSNAEEQQGQKVLATLRQKWELDYNHPKRGKVNEIVSRLTRAAGAAKDPWHVYVLKDPEFKNAAATRGNHVFIWTGMMNATSSDGELATVLAHEIGHVLARHSDPDPNETLRQALVQIGAMAAGVAVTQSTSNPMLAENAGRAVAGITQQVGNAIAVYPFSREKEYEADHIGLFLMTKAGYNPEDAVRFWKKAANDPSFSKSLEFLSTHPPATDRYQRLSDLVPKAEQRYGAGRSNSSSAENRRSSPGVKSWQIISAETELYTQPDRRARRLGAFPAGAEVRGIAAGDWLNVSAPVKGYLPLSGVVEMVSE